MSVGASKKTTPLKKYVVPAWARTNTIVQGAAADAEAESDAEKEREGRRKEVGNAEKEKEKG